MALRTVAVRIGSKSAVGRARTESEDTNRPAVGVASARRLGGIGNRDKLTQISSDRGRW